MATNLICAGKSRAFVTPVQLRTDRDIADSILCVTHELEQINAVLRKLSRYGAVELRPLFAIPGASDVFVMFPKGGYVDDKVVYYESLTSAILNNVILLDIIRDAAVADARLTDHDNGIDIYAPRRAGHQRTLLQRHEIVTARNKRQHIVDAAISDLHHVFDELNRYCVVTPSVIDDDHARCLTYVHDNLAAEKFRASQRTHHGVRRRITNAAKTADEIRPE